MLTYTLRKNDKKPLYEQLYTAIKADILNGQLKPGEKLPSKRSLKDHLCSSIITIEAAYAQLADEGYIVSEPKIGYFVQNIAKPAGHTDVKLPIIIKEHEKAVQPEAPMVFADFTSNRADTELFPFSIWARLLRRIISENPDGLLEKSEGCGIYSLRAAIAGHLSGFRGMSVSPDNIIIGAGTEYLYGLLIQLLGHDRIYCVEDPGYSTIERIYTLNGASCVHAGMDEQGIIPSVLSEKKADIVHISPTHQFPTGITMPVARRYELLGWAKEAEGRYIIEDDYDSEFRLGGKVLPPLFGMDGGDRVIYMNTFTKTLCSTIRISYMILPDDLAERYHKELGFYSCTVPNFEQYTLAAFISEGYFEKHINRSRLKYLKKREALIQGVKSSPLSSLVEINENDSGLHFIIKIKTELGDDELCTALLEKGIRIDPVSKYCTNDKERFLHSFIMSYSDISPELIPEIILKLNEFML